jgi:hypothetical protein
VVLPSEVSPWKSDEVPQAPKYQGLPNTPKQLLNFVITNPHEERGIRVSQRGDISTRFPTGNG